MRVYDKTNDNVVCESGDISGGTETLTDLGVISNVPSGKSVLELHVKIVSGSSKVVISELECYY